MNGEADNYRMYVFGVQRVNVMLINFSKWGEGTSEGVTRVAPYMAFPPFLIIIIES